MIEPIYAGSFDPITFGHIDVIKQTVNMFGHINIVVAGNPDKNSMFTPNERKQLIWDSLEGKVRSRAFVHTWEGLVVDYAKIISCGDNTVLIRGIRNVTDMMSELALADVNTELAGIKTIFIPTSNEYRNYSSSLVKELWKHGKDISKYVHPTVIKKMEDKKKEQERFHW